MGLLIVLILLFVAFFIFFVIPKELKREQEAEPPTDITPYIVWAVLIIVAFSAFASLFD